MSNRRRSSAPVAQWPLDAGINVVLFAGLGGTCEGLEEAGCPVHVCNNHDEVALAAHAVNHPHSKHIRGDIFDVDPVVATGGRRVKLLAASPDCVDHSVAKGGAPRSPRVRSLAWQLPRWLGKTRPEVFFLENVREIRGWGPLVAKRDKATGRVVKIGGTVAAKGEQVPVREQCLVRDPARAGRSYRRWKAHIARLGYAYEDRDLCCADYGIPTSRRRLFGIGRCDGLPIGWPERTHAPALAAPALNLKPWRSAAEIIDWSIPIASIFGRKKGLAEASAKRIAAGTKRYVLDNPQPFIAPLAPTEARPGLVAAWMAQHNLGVVGHPVTAPLSTLTTAGSQQQLVAVWLCKYYGEGGQAQGLDEPLHTIPTLARFGVVAVTIGGEPYRIYDIGMRMLEPSEAAAAHELRLPKHITVNGVTRALTKREGMRLIGNSVPKRMARLLAEANITHALQVREKAA